MTGWVLAATLVSYGLTVYCLGLWVGGRLERTRNTRARRPGYLPLAVYDWTRQDPPDAPIPQVALPDQSNAVWASDGPIHGFSDSTNWELRALDAGMSAVQDALDRDDMHSRKVKP